jgi:malate synthase
MQLAQRASDADGRHHFTARGKDRRSDASHARSVFLIINRWPQLMRGIKNILAALDGSLAYTDQKRQQTVRITEAQTVIFTRPRGLHLSQAGVLKGELVSAALFDVAMIVHQADVKRLRHPLVFYIPKSESALEALRWRDLFQALAKEKGLPADYIKCMALVESHPLAYQVEEFIYNLREHLIGLNLGRWDYMASLIGDGLQVSIHHPGGISLAQPRHV